jgi:hypothetical protein
MKSGAVVTFECTKVSVTTNALGERTGIKWTTPDGGTRRLLHIAIDEVAAIVFVDAS